MRRLTVRLSGNRPDHRKRRPDQKAQPADAVQQSPAPSGGKGIIRARHARAAFSAASESRVLKWPSREDPESLPFAKILDSDPYFTFAENAARVGGGACEQQAAHRSSAEIRRAGQV